MTISLSEFNSLPEKDKKEVLQELKKDLGVSGMVKAWEISRSKVYSMLKEFDIALDSKKGPKSKPEKPKLSFETENKELNKKVQTTSELSSDIVSNESKMENNKKISSLEMDGMEEAKFSLYLDTQGTGKLISQTLQLLLGSEQLSNSDLHLNISIEEI
ncbi:MAG: hypothetical protein PHX14_10285 [Syntrophomonadaceae bacterium]|nr:hypothetical protein [Syntrophomonadaceae bacterium]